MHKKWVSSLVMLVFILNLMDTFSVRAQSPLVSSSRIEGVLVVDVSKSMLESDPNKISNEAMKMFIDMSSLKGDKIGVIAYADDVMSMKDIVKLSTEQDKNSLKDFIDSLEKFPNTDLSVGVKEAVKVLENSHEKNYQPLIVLLADGNNDLNENKDKTTQQATDELNASVANAKAKGFPIYVIGLNANGDLNKEVLQSIATETNGKFFETSHADDLPRILSEIFADHLKLKIVPVNEQTGNGAFQDIPVTIPNENVLEANISLVSSTPVEIKLVNPDGKEMTIPSDNILLTKSKSYSMLKLKNPTQGNWTLKVKSDPQDKVDINVVFNYDLQLKLAPINTNGLKEGDLVKVAASFYDNGKKIASKDLYESMQAALFVKDLDTGKTKKIPLAAKEQGFTGQFTVGEAANYEFKVKAEGNSFYREIQPEKISIQKSSATALPIANPFEESPLTPWLYAVLALIGTVLLLVPAVRHLKRKWAANRGFHHQILVEIKNEDTGKSLEPQYKELKVFKEEFNLQQLVMLEPDFTEIEKITFVPITDNALLFFNKSNCTIEKNGVAIDAETFHRFKRNDKLRIMLNESNQSIYVKISSLEKKQTSAKTA